MVTEYKWDEAKIVVWCNMSDSDAYIGCKLKEQDYFEGWKNSRGELMQVEVRLREAGVPRLYAKGEDIKLIGTSGYFRLAENAPRRCTQYFTSELN